MWLVSRKRLPWRIFRSRSSGAFIPAMQALQNVGNPLAVLGAPVELEDELGSDAQPEAVGQLGSEEAPRMAQRLDGLQTLLFVLAQHRDLDHGALQVGGEVHLGDR